MLTQRELKELVTLLKKISRPKRDLPQPVFDALIPVLPFIACELVVTNHRGEILLTWRDDRYWKGWHFPGGLLRYGESFLHRIRYVARHELGVRVTRARFLSVLNYPGAGRGHGVSLVWHCTVDRTPKKGKFFRRMPHGIIWEHRRVWKNVRVTLATME
ncbi:MAG: NUDIX domain-containing protein [Rhodospirillales bacterium]|nr:MAG: NUDIX domain-containing protein [Rhodospirillales bacterium]